MMYSLFFITCRRRSGRFMNASTGTLFYLWIPNSGNSTALILGSKISHLWLHLVRVFCTLVPSERIQNLILRLIIKKLEQMYWNISFYTPKRHKDIYIRNRKQDRIQYHDDTGTKSCFLKWALNVAYDQTKFIALQIWTTYRIQPWDLS